MGSAVNQPLLSPIRGRNSKLLIPREKVSVGGSTRVIERSWDGWHSYKSIIIIILPKEQLGTQRGARRANQGAQGEL